MGENTGKPDLIAWSPEMPYNPVLYQLKKAYGDWGPVEPEFFIPADERVIVGFFDNGECALSVDGKRTRTFLTDDIQAIELTDGSAFHGYDPGAKIGGHIMRGPGRYPVQNAQTFFDRYGVRDDEGNPRKAKWSNFGGGALISGIGFIYMGACMRLWMLLPDWYFKAQGVAHVWDRHRRGLWGRYDAFTEEASAYLTLYSWIGGAAFVLLWVALLVLSWGWFNLDRFERMEQARWVYRPAWEKIVFLFMRNGERIPVCVTYQDQATAIAMHAQLNAAWAAAMQARREKPSSNNEEFYL